MPVPILGTPSGISVEPAVLHRVDAAQVARDHLRHRALGGDLAVLDEDHSVAQPLHPREVVADEHDRPPLFDRELADLVHALALERRIADREDLVDEQDLRSRWAATAKPSRTNMPLE